MVAAPKEHRPSGKPGRRLPTTLSEISSNNLNDDAKVLMLRLLELVIARFGTLTEMTRAAMAVSGTDSLHWARGTPSDRKEVRQACSRVSKFLGSSANQPVDWLTVRWLVQVCVADDERETRLANFAGLWCAATGKQRPPRYTGPIEHERASRPVLTDPELAVDDATRVALYQEQLAQALSRQQELEQQLQQRDNQIAELKREHDGQMADLARREELAELARTQLHQIREEYAKHQTEHWKLQSKLSQADLQLRQEHTTGEQLVNQLERAEIQMARLSHHLGVVVAHVLTRTSRSLLTPGQILPAAGLKMDPVLRSLLDVNLNPDAGPVTRWLAVYLRSLLTGVRSHRALTDSDLSDELTMVVTGQQLPSNQLLDRLFAGHPYMRKYGVVLRAAAIQNNEHLALAATANAPAHLAPPGVVSTPDKPTQQRSPDEQITVAELIARRGSIPPDIRRGRHRAPEKSAPPQVRPTPGAEAAGW